MASANRPQREAQPGDQPAQLPADVTDATAQSQLLQQVVAETIATGGLAAAADERDALLAVARRYRGQGLDHAPVVPELVLAILRLRFDRLQMDEAQWHELAATVASTLLETPDVRARLTTYWERLGQALA
ncbi:MAG: hypothetical protein MUF48_07825 [Pirellulaceae bacterium]|jgi:hypothetical protein|nr:hypothetical protein [Pirellulaceae bacterium]